MKSMFELRYMNNITLQMDKIFIIAENIKTASERLHEDNSESKYTILEVIKAGNFLGHPEELIISKYPLLFSFIEPDESKKLPLKVKIWTSLKDLNIVQFLNDIELYADIEKKLFAPNLLLIDNFNIDYEN